MFFSMCVGPLILVFLADKKHTSQTLFRCVWFEFNLNSAGFKLVNEALFILLQTEAAPQDGPIADKPVQTSLERPQKPTIGKPHRASVDRVKPNPEMTSKSPPPPPPRRFYPSGTGLTTGRSGEVIYTTRKESTSAQVRVSCISSSSN